MNRDEVRSLLLEAHAAALEAVDARTRTADALADTPGGDAAVVAIGKAAIPMVWGAADALGSRLPGVAVSHRPGRVPDGIELQVGSHPFPDEHSLRAADAVVDFLARGGFQRVIFLISGGGSALAERPPRGVSIEQLARIQRRLMHAGVAIGELNLVRRALSEVKNGRLLDLVDVPTTTLVVSDVGAEPPSAVASGPTIPQPVDAREVERILDDHGIAISTEVRRHLGEPVTDRRSAVTVIADDMHARDAAAAELRRAGRPVSVATGRIAGEARRQGPDMAAGAAPGFTVAAGEATVNVTGTGRGGRCSEAALAVAIAIDRTDTVFAAMSTDGNDGAAEASGAVVDGGTFARIVAAGMDPRARLADNDSAPPLRAAGDLVPAAPGGTNVADLWYVWRSVD